MRKRVSALLLSLLLAATFCMNASAGHIGEFEHKIRVEVDCSNCVEDPNREIKVQLYADGEAVPGTEVTLNSETGFVTTYEDLPVFRTEKGAEEIVYKAGVSEKGKDYRIMSSKKITYETKTIDSWVSVSPEDLRDGHEYVFLTENWNYENNGEGKYVLMKGDVNLEQTTPLADYTIIDGKKSYYRLEDEPSTDAIWTLSKITSDDPDYATHPGTWLLTNATGKRLVLSDFNNDSPNQVIWRFSGKNGHNDSEGTDNTNKLTITPVADNRSRFRLSATLSYDDPDRADQIYYVGVNHFYQIQPQTEADYSAQFVAFEHISREVKVATGMVIETELCAAPNPNTSDFTPYLIGIIAIAGVGAASVFIRKRR